MLSALVVKGSYFIVIRLWFDALPALRTPAVTQALAALGAAALRAGSALALAVAFPDVARVAAADAETPADDDQSNDPDAERRGFVLRQRRAVIEMPGQR